MVKKVISYFHFLQNIIILVYFNAFAYISDKPRLSPPTSIGPSKYSISLLFVESTARNHFFRQMPLTLKFMQEHDFQIMNGYNKVCTLKFLNSINSNLF